MNIKQLTLVGILALGASSAQAHAVAPLGQAVPNLLGQAVPNLLTSVGTVANPLLQPILGNITGPLVGSLVPVLVPVAAGLLGGVLGGPINLVNDGVLVPLLGGANGVALPPLRGLE